MLSTRVRQLGIDGWLTLLLSNLIILLTLLASLIPTLIYVYLRASNSSIELRCKTLIVLGERLINDLPGKNYRARLNRAIKLCGQHQFDRIFVVGGVTGGASVSEALCGKNYLLSKGLQQTEISIEDKSQHTLENIRNIRALLVTDKEYRLGIITNRFHLARAGILAAGLDVACELCAAEETFDYSLSQWLLMLKEAYFIHWYFTGKYWSILTRNQSSLNRIR